MLWLPSFHQTSQHIYKMFSLLPHKLIIVEQFWTLLNDFDPFIVIISHRLDYHLDIKTTSLYAIILLQLVPLGLILLRDLTPIDLISIMYSLNHLDFIMYSCVLKLSFFIFCESSSFLQSFLYVSTFLNCIFNLLLGRVCTRSVQCVV
jgi:hypothetical protein